MASAISPQSPDHAAKPIKQRRKRRKRVRNGRFYILLLFLWLRFVDVTFLVCVYPRLFQNQQQSLQGDLVVSAVWTTMLLIAIWFSQNWARYLLSGSILAAVVWAASTLPGLPDSLYPRRDLLLVVGFTGSYLPVALALIVSKHIRKHTTKKLEQAADGKQIL